MINSFAAILPLAVNLFNNIKSHTYCQKKAGHFLPGSLTAYQCFDEILFYNHKSLISFFDSSQTFGLSWFVLEFVVNLMINSNLLRCLI